jgi:hypothetical protein
MKSFLPMSGTAPTLMLPRLIIHPCITERSERIGRRSGLSGQASPGPAPKRVEIDRRVGRKTAVPELRQDWYGQPVPIQRRQHANCSFRPGRLQGRSNRVWPRLPLRDLRHCSRSVMGPRQAGRPRGWPGSSGLRGRQIPVRTTGLPRVVESAAQYFGVRVPTAPVYGLTLPVAL